MKTSETLSNWLKEIKKKGLDPKVKGLYFGLFESENGYTIYLTGAYSIDSFEWMLNEDYVADPKYLNLKSSKKWNVILGDIKNKLIKLLKEDLFDSENIEKICIGFDDGDIHFIK